MASLWQNELRDAVNSLEELNGYAFFEKRKSEFLGPVKDKYRILVPRYYLGLIDKDDPDDPIAKMAFPSEQENISFGMGMRDPIGDLNRQAAKRLTHRYPDRALLHVTNLCPMYCRFCFRKNLMNEREAELYSGEFTEALHYLEQHPEVEEIILTGGDPFMLSDEKLASLVSEIEMRLPQVKRLRFHSRMPVTLPSRITNELMAAIQRNGKFQTFLVTHFNHANELSDQAGNALQALRIAGIIVLNQSVLLRGINDDAATLRGLFRGLGNYGVLPYYLHQCDLVEGAEHFRVPLAEGQEIWRQLRGTIPGYLLPEFVMEIPGGGGKIPVGATFDLKKVLPAVDRDQIASRLSDISIV